MRTIGNILWHFPCFGFCIAFGVWLAGLFWILTIVGAPIGLGLWQYAKFLLAPFSNEMVDESVTQTEPKPNSLWKQYSAIVKICYYPFGAIGFCFMCLDIVALCVIIIGIPIAMILWKSLGTVLSPVGKVCISRDLKDRIMREKKIAAYEV
ncbi:MAG: YccF domain-containing protein [Thermoguttaceae bacterium]